MKPLTLPDLSTRPFNLSGERKMDAPADVLFQARTKKPDQWLAALEV
ncbi:hypothetical protein [Bacillus sp. M6-12]|nr:hypothetical protein [Bacillus sp. M6-12]